MPCSEEESAAGSATFFDNKESNGDMPHFVGHVTTPGSSTAAGAAPEVGGCDSAAVIEGPVTDSEPSTGRVDENGANDSAPESISSACPQPLPDVKINVRERTPVSINSAIAHTTFTMCFSQCGQQPALPPPSQHFHPSTARSSPTSVGSTYVRASLHLFKIVA